jgi:hypothetical protein
MSVAPWELNRHAIILLTLKTVLSISQNRTDQITSNKQIDNNLNEDIINASISLFLFIDASNVQSKIL